ncbi:hypothetical protein EHS25_005466 [Saitozyma podzolica]|uniref:FAS1 domain-containing protein n=1 Tax=Saitozyma podzolica TaxID=1890683 RepID=A0A427XYF2_9TREE|nr:hypothetical protein EHS25_005466 [Saitozyma podzolica]
MRPRILGLTAALFALGGTYALQNQLAFNPGAAREGTVIPLPISSAPLLDGTRRSSGGMPDSWFNGDGEPTRVGSEGASLADTLTVERRGRVWWDYARDVSSVTTRLTHAGRTTLLVPVDSAVMKMARKPHQNADGSTPNDETVQKNVAQWLAAHIVPSDVELPTSGPVKTLAEGVEVEIVQDGEGWLVKPGDIKVLGIKDASNGRILYLDGVLAA